MPPDPLGERGRSRDSALVVLGVARLLIPCGHSPIIHLIISFAELLELLQVTIYIFG